MSSDHGDGADPYRSKPTRAQPHTGMPTDGTQVPEGEEPPPGGAHGTPPRGSGTTRPVGGPARSETPGTPPPPPTPAGGPAPGTGTGAPSYGGEGTGAAPPPSAGGPDLGKPSAAAHGAGAAASSPHGGSASGPTPHGGSGPGATPPPGDAPPPGGSPYDTPPAGGMPPPPPPYGGGDAGGAGYGGAAYGAPDPRLAGMPPLAGLGRRLLARIIDALIVYIPVSIFLTIIGSIDDFGDTDNTGSSYGWGLLGMVVYLLYEGLMLTRSGQTVGKKLMGIRVGMLENGAVPAGSPGWIRACVYSLPQLVPCLGTLFWLYNVLSCTWDKPYRQAVHDKAAKTVVVSTEGRRYTP